MPNVDELQGVITSMTAQMARLEAQAERTEREYRSEKAELEREIQTLRQSVSGSGAFPTGPMGMPGMPPTGMPGMPGMPPMQQMGMPPMMGATMPAADAAGSQQMQMMQMMMSMAQSNPALMQSPQFMQMMQMAMGQQPAPTSQPVNPQPFAQPAASGPATAAAAAPPAPRGDVGAGSSASAATKGGGSASTRAWTSSASTRAGTLEGGSTADQIKALNAEREKIAARSLSASTRAASASKIASIRASAVSQAETGVDLCILMDCTGSMGPYIQAAKDKMALVVDQAREKFHVDLRVAFVGYRDYCDQERFVIKDFVCGDRIGEVVQMLRGCSAYGGGDAPEDVAGGLEKALGMTWSSRIKMLVHVADAPAHGSEYHDGLGDNHDGPQDPDPAALMTRLGDKRVAFYFFKINSSTDKMVGKLREAHKNSRREFKVFELGSDVNMFARMMLDTIASSVRDAGVTLPSGAAHAGSRATTSTLDY